MKHILTISTLVFATSCFGQEACPNMYDGNGNGTIDIEDFLGVLGLFGDVDVDSDGLWDSQDACTDLDACNFQFPESEYCTYPDAVGNCYGNCSEDADEDGVCDEFACGESVTYFGYDYSTALIGNRCWFSENLRCQQYYNGDSIASNLTGSEWNNIEEGACSWHGQNGTCYNNYSTDIDVCDNEDAQEYLGLLYNHQAVTDTRSLCPSGWHISTYSDFYYLNAFTQEQLKSEIGWENYENGNNYSGFNCFPHGSRDPGGNYYDGGFEAMFWVDPSSIIGGGPGEPYFKITLEYDVPFIEGTANPKYGAAVRCVQDPE